MKTYIKFTLSLVVAILISTACNYKQTSSDSSSPAKEHLQTARDHKTSDDADLLAQLDSVKCSCIVRNNGVTTRYTQQGVRDLFELVTTQPEVLRGAHVADKIIGKGAAALMVNGGIKRATTHVITTPALKMLRDAGVEVCFEEEIPYVVNREKTGQCPLDERLKEIDDASLCLPLIKQFIEDLNNDKVVI